MRRWLCQWHVALAGGESFYVERNYTEVFPKNKMRLLQRPLDMHSIHDKIFTAENALFPFFHLHSYDLFGSEGLQTPWIFLDQMMVWWANWSRVNF